MSVQGVTGLRISIRILLHQILALVELELRAGEAIVVCKGAAARLLAISTMAKHGALVVSGDSHFDGFTETSSGSARRGCLLF